MVIQSTTGGDLPGEDGSGPDFGVAYDRFTARIDAEDGLIDNRMQWLLVSQSILFAALGLGSSGSGPGSSTFRAMAAVLPWIGATTAFLQWISIVAAFLTSMSVRAKMIERYLERSAVADPNRGISASARPRVALPETHKDLYPQLDRTPSHLYLGFLSPVAVPIAFVGGWLYLIVHN